MTWKPYTLGDVCERVTVGHVGTTAEHYTDETGIPFLRTQNVSKGGIVLDDLRYITPKFHKELKKSTLKQGDVLLSRVVSGSMNCGIVPSELDGANCANIILVRPKGDKLHPKYLLHYLGSDSVQRDLLSRRVGSAQSVVNTNVLKSWKIPLPPLSEQRRITAILDKADALRAKRRGAIAKLDQLLKSVFLDMFGDPNIDSSSDEALGFLDVFTDVSAGHIKTKQEDYLPEGPVPIIDQGQGLIGGYTGDESVTSPVPLPVIVFGDHTRCVKFVDFAFAVGADGVKVLRPRQDDEPMFLYCWLKYRRIPSAGYSRHFKFLKEARLQPPPLAQQQRFASIARRIEQCEHILQSNAAQLDTLFSALQHRAFSGTL